MLKPHTGVAPACTALLAPHCWHRIVRFLSVWAASPSQSCCDGSHRLSFAVTICFGNAVNIRIGSATARLAQAAYLRVASALARACLARVRCCAADAARASQARLRSWVHAGLTPVPALVLSKTGSSCICNVTYATCHARYCVGCVARRMCLYEVCGDHHRD